MKILGIIGVVAIASAVAWKIYNSSERATLRRYNHGKYKFHFDLDDLWH